MDRTPSGAPVLALHSRFRRLLTQPEDSEAATSLGKALQLSDSLGRRTVTVTLWAPRVRRV